MRQLLYQPILSCFPNYSLLAIRPRIWFSSPPFKMPVAQRWKNWPAKHPMAARPCLSACPGAKRASSTMLMRFLITDALRRFASRLICPITACLTKSESSLPAPCLGRLPSAGCAWDCPFAKTFGARTLSNVWLRRAQKFCLCLTVLPIGAARATSGSILPSHV